MLFYDIERGATMLTEFGKALRIIRIEAQEILKDMASSLGVSSAYLSAVETGKRRIPSDWVEKIIKAYSLSAEKADELRKAAEKSICEVKIPLYGASAEKREAVLTFAKALDGLSSEELAKIMSAMKGKKSERGEERRA